MAESRKSKSLLGNEKLVSKAKDSELSLSKNEIGNTGIKISNGLIYEDLKKELTFPYSVATFKQMSYDPIIAAGLSFYEYMMLKANWRVKAPEDPTDEELEQKKFIEECMHDMEHSWNSFIQEVSSMNTYGFSVHEIVLRPRTRAKGSKYDDGKIGWRKLPIRGQDTIDKWEFSKDGTNKLLAVEQKMYTSSRANGINVATHGSTVRIPRKKFLLFRTGKRKDNPFGESVLKSVYFAWKYRTSIEETEAVGIDRDLSGLPVVYIPPQYMAEDASPEQKAVYEYYKNLVRNIQLNQQGGAVIPMAYDAESKQPLFKFELMGVEGGKSYKTTEIIQRWDNKILTAMGCDILVMGQSNTGSYALGSIKSNMTAIAVESRLKEICDVVNNQLIPITAKMNGWDLSRLPRLAFDDLESTNIEDWSKALQRAGSIGFIERDRSVLNKIREMLGVDAYPEDEEVHEELLTGNDSRAGDGMATSGDGTSTDANNIDSNDDNLDNK